MIQMSAMFCDGSARLVRKTMLAPSGVQPGWVLFSSRTALLVSRWGASAVVMSRTNTSSERLKAMCLPSGAHEGCCSSLPVKVSCVPTPSRAKAQTSLVRGS